MTIYTQADVQQVLTLHHPMLSGSIPSHTVKEQLSWSADNLFQHFQSRPSLTCVTDVMPVYSFTG